MPPDVKGVPLCCPHCPSRPPVVTGDGDGLRCDTCGRSFPKHRGVYSFLLSPTDVSGYWDVGPGAPERSRKQRLFAVWSRLMPPRVYAGRHQPHMTLLRELYAHGETKALFIGYDQEFPEGLRDDVVQLEIMPKRHTDVVGVGERLPFPEAAFDLVVLSGVIEHTQKPTCVSAEAFRVLRSGGRLYISSPWVYPFHGGDNYRFSDEGLRLLCDRFEEEEIGSLHGPLHAIGILLQQLLADALSFGNRYLRYVVSLPIAWAVYPLLLADLVVNRRHKRTYRADANIYGVFVKP